MKRRILIADDNVSIRKDLQTFLVTQGFEIIAVGNGDLAAQRAQEIHPELAIIDVFMPGKTGYEVCKHIKHTLELLTPVVLTYGEFEPIDMEEVKRVNADCTLQKPFIAEVLLNTLSDLLKTQNNPEQINPDLSWADVAADVASIEQTGEIISEETCSENQKNTPLSQTSLEPEIIEEKITNTSKNSTDAFLDSFSPLPTTEVKVLEFAISNIKTGELNKKPINTGAISFDIEHGVVQIEGLDR